MKKILGLFENKRSLVGIILLGTLVATTYQIQENSSQIKKLTNFESGIQTCFTRVNQTYTANLLGDKASDYLTQNFQNLTEECLAEGILSLENTATKEMSNVAKLLGNLASNVHWFHEDVLAPSGKSLGASKERRDVGSRFEKIENTKDEILDSTTAVKTAIVSSLNSLKNIFYAVASVLAVLMISEFMSLTKRRLLNKAREKEAEIELGDNGGVTSVKLGDIIKGALEQNDLDNCAKLFSNFHAHAAVKSKPVKIFDNLVTPAPTKVQAPVEALNTSKIDEMWNDDSMGFEIDRPEVAHNDTVALGNVSAEVLELLSEKVYATGVSLEADLNDSIQIAGNRELVHQGLYHLYAYAINASSAISGTERKISIFAHKLGEVISFDLIHTGNGFDEQFLKHRIGLDSKKSEFQDIDLQVAEGLFSEVNAKTQFDNKIDQTGAVIGGRVKIIFRSAVTKGKLVDLKVGSKKEILESMRLN